MTSYILDSLNIILAGIFILLNGFFVAAEFALVKVRATRLDELKGQSRPFANTAIWLFKRQNLSLSACQVGITMASLALGWIGEPAIAHLLQPLFIAMGITSQVALHATAFAVAFTIITTLHIVLGEQVPKIYSIRRPGIVLLWCAAPLKAFYILLYPFMILLNSASIFLLRKVGIQNPDEHDTPLSEEEIRASLSPAHVSGYLTSNEHRLLNAVFKFDDMICRQVMVPRVDVEFLNIDQSFAKCLKFARESNHTRLPLCKGSLDNVIGIIHVKNLLGFSADQPFDLIKVAREPLIVYENLPLSHLLNIFQTARQHMALVVDEYGTIVGIVTLENVLEQLVGAVQDEFDFEPPNIVADGPGQYIILGGTLINELNEKLNLNLRGQDVDTVAGLLVERVGQISNIGKKVSLVKGVMAEVLEIKRNRVTRVRLILSGTAEQDSTKAIESE
jgi:CBS domain containing-hemolysin-like protein